MDTYETGGGAAVAQAATAGGPVSRGYREEIEHWAWCIRNPDPKHKPHCTPEVALGDAVIALTSNLAIEKQSGSNSSRNWFDFDERRNARRQQAAAGGADLRKRHEVAQRCEALSLCDSDLPYSCASHLRLSWPTSF